MRSALISRRNPHMKQSASKRRDIEGECFYSLSLSKERKKKMKQKLQRTCSNCLYAYPYVSAYGNTPQGVICCPFATPRMATSKACEEYRSKGSEKISLTKNSAVMIKTT